MSQKLVFGLLSQRCYDTLINNLEYDVPCLTQLLSKAIGYGIVLGASVVKLPQVFKVVQSKRTDQLSPAMFLMEIVGYLIGWGYFNHFGYSFSTYGETVFLLLQNALLLCLVFHYNKQPARIFAFLAVLGGLAAVAFTPGLVSNGLWPILQTSTIPLFAASRIPQIMNNYQAQSTGMLSFVSVFLVFMGGLGRIFTTLQEISDPIVLFGITSGLALNGVILLQILYYWKNTNKLTAKQDGKKTQ